jgi:hypothetical protein
VRFTTGNDAREKHRSETVGLVPSPLEQPTCWWEAEFWNKDVKRVLRVDGGPTLRRFRRTTSPSILLGEG